MTGTVEEGLNDMELSADDIRRVLEALDASEWDEAVITVGDVRIAVARNGATLTDGASVPGAASGAQSAPAAEVAAPASTPAAAPTTAPPGAAPADVVAEPAPASAAADQNAAGTTVLVEAPSVGVFWRAPEPGAAPFVEVGQKVTKGDTLGIVEVMKLMSHVDAPTDGTVVAIHVDNAHSVEFGTPLITIAVDEG